MRFMVIVKSDKSTEAGVMPETDILRDMGQFNEALVKAGVMLAGEGLHPSSRGVRVKFSKGEPTITDGPFPDPESLVAGFWIWQVKSKDEVIEWLRRSPFARGEDAELEIRQIFEADDFGPEFTPELREQEERLRAEALELERASRR